MEIATGEQAEWSGFRQRCLTAKLTETEADKLGEELRAAGVRLLPAPDSVSMPGGTTLAVSEGGLRFAADRADVSAWLEARHDNLWPTGWSPAAASREVSWQECYEKCSARLREAVERLDDPVRPKAALGAERIALAKQVAKLV